MPTLRHRSLRHGLAVLLAMGGVAGLFGPGTAARAQAAGDAAGAIAAPNPLAVGEAAMAKGDTKSALAFFTRYTAENPDDVRARFLLGGTRLQMSDAKGAAADYIKAIEIKPDYWPAHFNLVVADAVAGNWPGFDKERAFLQAAREAGKPGLAKDGHDIIDLLRVHDVNYQVWAFPQLYGRYHARYVFLHFGPDGHPVDWVQCESDDPDQMFFRQRHPQEAAAGGRSFSLDSYRVEPNGTSSQGLIKFYWDGEPTYEEVRADALAVLAGKAHPSASTREGTPAVASPEGTNPGEVKPEPPPSAAPHR